MNRYYYYDKISNFLNSSSVDILGTLAKNNEFSLELDQRETWIYQIEILKQTIKDFSGSIFFEYAIPRMGRRIDVVLIIENVLFILEFKVGETKYYQSSIDQVWDYALDLKNFHETSRDLLIAPILIATEATNSFEIIATTAHNDNLLLPIKTNSESLLQTLLNVLKFEKGQAINADNWIAGRYSPTPTIIEAAAALYSKHTVEEITRNDSEAINLSITSESISEIIENSQKKGEKAICFVTGVPGAGKTLVGLNVATKHMDKEHRTTSVYLSGNGPLVTILREALTRDKVKREKEIGNKIKKGEAFGEVKAIIQNIHNFRDECIIDKLNPPFDHVAIFDEAQRAWNKAKTSDFMKRRKKILDFSHSEPEFLISCLDRHKDWAVIVCLIGGGQEIHTGEAGISEWITSINNLFPEWKVYVSDKLTDSEYAAGEALELLKKHKSVTFKKDLHLSVSLRSFRAENLSLLVKNLLDINIDGARKNYQILKDKYPFVITRNLSSAKKWLKEKARGTERYGIVVSSQAQRLKPHAIDVKSPMDPVHWFLDGKEDTRSSYYLEDVATEFHVQGLELDYACVTWDGDFRYSNDGWKSFSFVGSRWNNINKPERKLYLKNAYRVLLTRARQGMVIVVPNGDLEDPTRNPAFYDDTFNYLSSIGFTVI